MPPDISGAPPALQRDSVAGWVPPQEMQWPSHRVFVGGTTAWLRDRGEIAQAWSDYERYIDPQNARLQAQPGRALILGPATPGSAPGPAPAPTPACHAHCPKG